MKIGRGLPEAGDGAASLGTFPIPVSYLHFHLAEKTAALFMTPGSQNHGRLEVRSLEDFLLSL